MTGIEEKTGLTVTKVNNIESRDGEVVDFADLAEGDYQLMFRGMDGLSAYAPKISLKDIWKYLQQHRGIGNFYARRLPEIGEQGEN